MIRHWENVRFEFLLEGEIERRGVVQGLHAAWPDKNRQMSVKVGQNNFTRKMIDFDTFTKIALECERFLAN